MLLSEILGVKQDVEFEVIGYIGRFIIRERFDATERLLWRLKDIYVNADLDILYDIIFKAPANIIHLPPPLTDEQREQLKAIWTLGGRWLAKDFDDVVNYYTHKPHKESGWWYVAKNDDGRYGHRIPLSSAVCKLQELDKEDEPYDIGKALGVGK